MLLLGEGYEALAVVGVQAPKFEGRIGGGHHSGVGHLALAYFSGPAGDLRPSPQAVPLAGVGDRGGENIAGPTSLAGDEQPDALAAASEAGGEIATNRIEEQEISVLSLHLLQNCLVYVNTLMIQQVLADPDWTDRMTPHDFKSLTPLIFAHANPYGKFELDMEDRIPLEAVAVA